MLELFYAPNAVVRTLTGAAIAGAIRATFIVDAALNGLLLSKSFSAPLQSQNMNDDDTEAQYVDAGEVDASPAKAALMQNRTIKQTQMKLVVSMRS